MLSRRLLTSLVFAILLARVAAATPDRGPFRRIPALSSGGASRRAALGRTLAASAASAEAAQENRVVELTATPAVATAEAVVPAAEVIAPAAATAADVDAAPPGAAAGPETVTAPSPSSSADEACCARLRAINFTSTLPTLIVDTSAPNVTQASREFAAVCTCSWGLTGIRGVTTYGKIKVRGNSSAKLPKKGYSLHLVDAEGAANEAKFLGMPKSDDWAFYATDALDLTEGMRNYLAYAAYRQTGRWGPATQYVEIFLVAHSPAVVAPTSAASPAADVDAPDAAASLAPDVEEARSAAATFDAKASPLSMDDYLGLYLAEEHPSRASNRVDVKKWKAEDPSGGYIFVYDNDNLEGDELQTGLVTGFEFGFAVKYPDGKTKGPAAATWLTNHLEVARASLYGKNWTGEVGATSAPTAAAKAAAGRHTAALVGPSSATNLSATGVELAYDSYLDRDSWVDYFLHTELSKNPDGYRGSTYMSKDKDGPIKAGPPWDFNEAFGECCGFPFQGYDDGGASGPGKAGGSAISAAGWRFMICADQDRCVFDPTDGMSMWYRRLWNDTAFRNAASERWAELREDVWSDAFFDDIFERVPPTIADAVVRDLDWWGDELTMPYYSSGEEQWTKSVALLQTWVVERLAWLDEAFAFAGSAEYVYPGTDADVLAGYTEALSVAAADGLASTPS